MQAPCSHGASCGAAIGRRIDRPQRAAKPNNQVLQAGHSRTRLAVQHQRPTAPNVLLPCSRILAAAPHHRLAPHRRVPPLERFVGGGEGGHERAVLGQRLLPEPGMVQGVGAADAAFLQGRRWRRWHGWGGGTRVAGRLPGRRQRADAAQRPPPPHSTPAPTGHSCSSEDSRWKPCSLRGGRPSKPRCPAGGEGDGQRFSAGAAPDHCRQCGLTRSGCLPFLLSPVPPHTPQPVPTCRRGGEAVAQPPRGKLAEVDLAGGGQLGHACGRWPGQARGGSSNGNGQRVHSVHMPSDSP